MQELNWKNWILEMIKNGFTLFATLSSLAFWEYLYLKFALEWLYQEFLEGTALDPYAGDILLSISFLLILIPHIWMMSQILFKKSK